MKSTRQIRVRVRVRVRGRWRVRYRRVREAAVVAYGTALVTLTPRGTVYDAAIRFQWGSTI